MLALLAAATFATDATPIQIEGAFTPTLNGEQQWETFRTRAAPDALLFVQSRTGETAPPDQTEVKLSIFAEPHVEIRSCDGSLAVTDGAVSWDNEGYGRYRTVWRREASGRWLWVLHARWQTEAPYQQSTLNLPRPTCPSTAPATSNLKSGAQGGGSIDNSLRWVYLPINRGMGLMAINAWVGRGFLAIMNDSVASAPLTP